MALETFFAVWIRTRDEERWLGLDEDRAPFLFDEATQARSCAENFRGVRSYEIVRLVLHTPESADTFSDVTPGSTGGAR